MSTLSLHLPAYTLEYKTSDGEWETWPVSADAAMATITGLAADTAYIFQLTAANESGSASVATTASTPALPVTGIITTTPSGDAMPVGKSAVNEWQPFWFEVWTEAQLLETTTVTLDYDANLFVLTMENNAVPAGVTLVVDDGRSDELTGLTQCVITITLDGQFVWQEDFSRLVSLAFTPTQAVTGSSDSGVPADDISRSGWLSLNGESIDAEVWAVPYDLNNSGTIDIYDLIQFAKTYGGTAASHPASDFNGDGMIDIYDLIQFAKSYGSGIENTSIVIPQMNAAMAAESAESAMVESEDAIPAEIAAMFGLKQKTQPVAEIPVAEPVAVAEPEGVSPPQLPVPVVETLPEEVAELPVAVPLPLAIERPAAPAAGEAREVPWSDYDSLGQAFTHADSVAPPAEDSATTREIVEFLFAENRLEEEIAETGLPFFQIIQQRWKRWWKG